MTDPNQRARRHGKPRTGYDISENPRTGPQQGYYDSSGYFHPAGQTSGGKPVLNPAGQPRQSTEDRSRVNSAGQPGNASRQNNRKRPASGKHRRGVFLLKAFLLIIFCLSAGFIWHYMSTMDSLIPGTTIGTSIPKASDTAANHVVVTPTLTDTVIPYAQLITYSSDPAKPLYGKVIILDPGHGGKDSGCIYPTKKPEYTESVINLQIAESTKASLEAQGATVIMLRTDDSWVSLYHRIALTHLNCLQYADEFKINEISTADRKNLISELSDTIQINSDTIDTGGMGIMVGTGVGSELKLLMNLEKDLTDILYLSIHINSNPTSSLHGTQVYYVTDESVIASEEKTVKEDSLYQDNPLFPIRSPYYGRDGERNQVLAQSLYESIISSAPQMETNAQSVLADNYAVLRENNLAGALIEVGFISNKKDRNYMTNESFVSKIADGIASGCINFFAYSA